MTGKFRIPFGNVRRTDRMTLPLPQAHLTYARSVQGGAQTGIDECKHQFAWDRWNCPDSATQLKGLKLGKWIIKNTIMRGRSSNIEETGRSSNVSRTNNDQ